MCCTARATNRNLKNEVVRPRFSRDARYRTPLSSAVAKLLMTDEAVRSKLKGPVLVASELSGLTVNHPPPSRLWGSGNPALWAGFPSAVGKSALRLFHCAASPQPFADRYLSQADPRRCSAPRHAAHSAGSAFHPGADARPPCNPLAWLASVLAGSVKSDFESSPGCPGSPCVQTATKRSLPSLAVDTP